MPESVFFLWQAACVSQLAMLSSFSKCFLLNQSSISKCFLPDQSSFVTAAFMIYFTYSIPYSSHGVHISMMIIENRLILELPPVPGNPRNSEGDFLRLKDGRLLFAYSRYRGDSVSDDAPCDIAGLISDDDGEHFTALLEPLIKASDHGVRNIMSVSMVRLQNGEAVIFYLCKYEKGTDIFLRRIREHEVSGTAFSSFSGTVSCEPASGAAFRSLSGSISPDSASAAAPCVSTPGTASSQKITLSEPELVYEGRDRAYLVMNNSRVLVKRDGSLILPVAVHQLITEADGHTHGKYQGEVIFIEGDRDARVFRLLSGPYALSPIGYSRTGLQEPCITELPDGRLQALYRTDLMCQYESFSKDGGKSFCPPLPSRFTSPDSPIEIAENPYSGCTGNVFRFLAVWNPVPNYNGRIRPGIRWITAGRTPLAAAVSSDGLAYGEPLVIEDDLERGFCYSAVFFTGPDTFLLAYCAGNAADGNCLARLRIRKIRMQ